MIKSLYIHIPFCKTICTYCDFCKIYYHKNFILDYLSSLDKEIDKYYQNDLLKTIYIGGGTPSCLEIEELKILFLILKKLNKTPSCEFTFEVNVEDLNYDKLQLLYDYGVNRLSIGIQTFNQKHLKFLNRFHRKNEVIEKINMVRKIGFSNINVDLIYALPNQNKHQLLLDLKTLIDLNIEHISAYSLIIEPNTILSINQTSSIAEDLDYEMYLLIHNYLTNHNYIHYEISNYAKAGYQSKHNLGYWNNEEYYGFGLGASGFVKGVRYTNNRGIKKYLNHNYRLLEEKMNLKKNIENELMLGLRKIKGINKIDFKNKYEIDINEIYSIKKMLEEGKLIDDGTNIYIKFDYIYISNDILIELID